MSRWIGWIPYKEPPPHWHNHSGTIDWLIDNPAKHSTRLHYGVKGGRAACGRAIPEPDDTCRAVAFYQ